MENPWEFLSVPKLSNPLPTFLYAEETQQFLDRLPNEQTLLSVRDRAIVELLYGSGIRVGELVSLKIEQADLEQQQLRVLGKGNKERMVLFGRAALEALETYLTTVRPRWLRSNTPWIFLNRSGTQLTARSVQRVLKALSIKSGMLKRG